MYHTAYKFVIDALYVQYILDQLYRNPALHSFSCYIVAMIT